MADLHDWPSLPLPEWQNTYHTLHMWTQIVGKIRLTLSPPLNHFWHSALYVDPRGLTTGPIPFPHGLFEIRFDFVDHVLHISTSEAPAESRPLTAEPVAGFYAGLREMLAGLGIAVTINLEPQEVADAIPFDRDFTHRSYDPEYANRFWRILVSTSKVLERFRSGFVGKCSPVQFFWGSCDLACTRFSGRPAPPRRGVISGPSYSHECSSAGFWPGGGAVDGPAYYAYTVPKPDGLEAAFVRPDAARWNPELGEFILMHEDLRHAESPEDVLFDFIRSTYDAGATLGRWDRSALEVPKSRGAV